MAFTRMAFNPSDGLKNAERYPATPSSEDEARGQIQGLLDQLKTATNNLMAALENADTEVSGAAKIGSEPVANLEYQGASPATVRGQIIALNEKITNAITNGLSISQIIGDGDITGNMLAEDAVTAGKIADSAVVLGNIAPHAVSQENLDTIQEITLDSGTTLLYDITNRKLKLKVSGCMEAQLCPVIFGEPATPPAGTYPAGTVYIQYVAS